MNNKELYKLLEVPEEVIDQLNEYEEKRKTDIPESIYGKLFRRDQWEEGIKELQNFLQDDENGIKILWEQLNILSTYSYKEYIKRNIPEDIFVATMKFTTRFLNSYLKTYGFYKYNQAWWFPRQMSLQEYRIGELEYEFIDGKEREIAVHIPSDADMQEASIQKSFDDFMTFRDKFFSDWKGVRFTCESWMTMPDLRELLGDESKIVKFQKRFTIEKIDREAVWYMGWIFPGYTVIDESLPENTTLQRKLKRYLLEGNVFGIAKGYIEN